MDNSKLQRAEAFYNRKLGQRLRSLRFDLEEFFKDFPAEYDRLKEIIESVKGEEERKAAEMAVQEIAQRSQARSNGQML